MPDKTLATATISGGKHEKARITVVMTCNASGLEQLPCWVVGGAAKPHAFRAVGVNMDCMDVIYCHNGTKSMTTSVMLEYLRWFDCQMQGRQVILLMDNFSAHECAVSQLEQMGTDGLQNTQCIWLPANATSIHQPLDQGIIAAWKVYYKRRWLDHVWDETEVDRSPLKTVNILKSI